MEHRLKECDLNYRSRDKNPYIEYLPGFPCMVETHFNMSVRNDQVPSYHEFEVEYVRENYEYLIGLKLSYEEKLDLVNRLKLGYMSFTRELHGNLFFRDHGYKVVYSTALDSHVGVDSIINDCLGLNLYTGTSRARGFRKEKECRHKDVDIRVEDFPLDMRNGKHKVVSSANFKYYLYDESYIPKLDNLLGGANGN